jgi:exopolysaccharide biosynthesis polyprenyl glycosylphosphotransferase
MFLLLILIAVVTFLSALLLTRVFIRIANRYHIGDAPGPRKVHKVFMPYLGGAAILLAILIGTGLSIWLVPAIAGLVPHHYYILGCACVFMSLIGLYDDLKKIRFSTKFYAQIIAAIMVVVGGLHFDSIYLPLLGVVPLGVSSWVLVIFWIVFITNAMNLLDGLDGLAAGVSTIIFAVFAAIAWQSGRTLVGLVNILFIFANLGFLRYNRHPAKIFMGDAGSLFIGFSTAVISLEIGRIPETNTLNMLLPLTVMAVPVLDTMISFFRRASKRMHPFRADKEHIHHRLMSIGFSHRNAVRVIYFFSIITGLIGLSFVWLDPASIITLLFVCLVLATMLIRRLGYVEIEKNLIVVENTNGNGNGNGATNGLTAALNGNGHQQQRFIPFETSRFVQSLLFIVSDLLFSAVAFLIVYLVWARPVLLMHFDLRESPEILWVVWSVLYWIILFGLNDLYHIEWDTSRIDAIFSILKIGFLGTLFLLLLSFEIPFLNFLPKRYFVYYGLLIFGGVSLGRVWLISLLKRRGVLEFKKRSTLIIGASERAQNIAARIRKVPELKYDLKGYIDNHANGNVGKLIDGLPILGDYQKIDEIIKKEKIKEVIIALDDADRDGLMDLIALLNQSNVSIKLAPYFYNLLSGFRTSHVYGVSLIKFFGSNMRTWQWIFKRGIDIIISLGVLLILLPVWLVMSILIVLDSKGPIFYRQKRVGKNKRMYAVIKFRSMVKDAEDLTGPKWASKDDPRVTRVGRFLRRTGLDEIPQFVNVLFGDMSIVGPRPERPYFVSELEQTIQFYSRRLIVKPGITGWAQIKHKYDESVDDVREKLRYDLYYIENMSTLLDLKIIVQTILIGMRKRQHIVRN